MKNKYFFIVAIIFIFSGCYSPTANLYKSEKTEGVDFNKYKTFAWLPTKDTSYTSLANKASVENALSNAVLQQLTQRGMVLDTLHPDCLFTYKLLLTKTYTVGEEAPYVYTAPSSPNLIPGQYNTVYYYTPQPYYYDPNAYSGSIQVSTFRNGTLVIDMIGRKDDKIIWRTSAEGKVNEKERKGVRPTIKEIVPVMFKKFPVK